MKDLRRGDPLNPPPGGMPMVHLHERCTPAFFASTNDTGLSRRRIQELADWYSDQTHKRYSENTLDTAALNDELRATLREEVAFPEHVDIEFKRVMDLALAV